MSKRKYTHIKIFEEEILALKAVGKTKREIAKTILGKMLHREIPWQSKHMRSIV